ncbi:hypothetical protein AB0I28_07845 [Phytomonospora sp. NPDC050363]|uniref:hypothetical protein n=1 Tax=Phytomonospora sp. NPDC050363 TaxID=3155642 RepID=UPI0034026B6B
MPLIRSLRAAAAVAVVALVATACGGARDLSEEKPTALQNEWWSWVMSAPVHRHPVTDTTGEFCAEAQPDDLWFLAGTFGETGGTVTRTCQIPAGRPIVVPAVNILVPSGAVFEEGPVAVLGCVEVQGQLSGSVALDGEELVLDQIDGAQINVGSGVMGNPLTRDLSGIDGAGCGLWARIEPLSPGEHTLAIRGEAPGFSTAVDYVLTVTE